ncbi:hypothetical protein RND61_10205 [Streptomyces sp. TRM76323]|uniref:Uncharacterized protein n=1 Tax=Streptomyces tamarix TaxID=3078565 RepID=A0ABU3QI55_9ACTN|nr:hypothetical protein [Streptomyces tamarix]MDT9682437.1 hypothetical protein [Streptomyces tamarix]
MTNLLLEYEAESGDPLNAFRAAVEKYGLATPDGSDGAGGD